MRQWLRRSGAGWTIRALLLRARILRALARLLMR
jgi:hypothetical protein